MASKKDGVADGWILYKAWCERNGGTPIRGTSSADHICFIGPLPEDTIDPGDDGTVETAPDGLKPEFRDKLIDLNMKAIEIQEEKSKIKFEIAKDRIKSFKR